MVAVWVGSSWTSLAGNVHVVLAIALAMLAGALWAGIAGFLKATVGAHEVITTIMLNWIAYWIGRLRLRPGRAGSRTTSTLGRSRTTSRRTRLHVFWGEPELQGLHIGLLIAAALVVFHLVINRTTLGYEVRAVGFNPEAARYGGINVARNYFLAMAIGGFAGLGGALDILGWQFRLGVLDVQSTQIGYIGIAVALLGRNTAIGVGLSALLFGALLTGTSTRTLDPSVFPPELAGNLTKMIQALVLLFIGADLLILYLWRARRKLRLGRRTPPAQEVIAARAEQPPIVSRVRGARGVGILGIAFGALAFWLALPPIATTVSPASGVLRHARRRSGDLGDHTGREAGRLGRGGSRDLRGRARLPRDAVRPHEPG